MCGGKYYTGFRILKKSANIFKVMNECIVAVFLTRSVYGDTVGRESPVRSWVLFVKYVRLPCLLLRECFHCQISHVVISRVYSMPSSASLVYGHNFTVWLWGYVIKLVM